MTTKPSAEPYLLLEYHCAPCRLTLRVDTPAEDNDAISRAIAYWGDQWKAVHAACGHPDPDARQETP